MYAFVDGICMSHSSCVLLFPEQLMAPVVRLSIVIIITLLHVLFLCVVVSEVPWLVVVGCMEQLMKKKKRLS